MRKSIFIAILLVVCGIIHGYGQGIAVYPFRPEPNRYHFLI